MTEQSETTEAPSSPFRCFLFGEGPLLVRCAEILLDRHQVLGVVTADEAVRHWARSKGVESLGSPSTSAPGTVLSISGSSLDVATGRGALRLRAFRALDGSELSPTKLAGKHGLTVGSLLPVVGVDRARRLEAEFRAVAASEPFWRERLAGLRPYELPLARPAVTGPMRLLTDRD